MTNRHMHAAETLLSARINGAPCGPISTDFPEKSLADAYEIQNQLHRARIATGGTQFVGYKVGLSSSAAMQKFQVSEPASGRLYSDMELMSGSTLEFSKTIQPLLEGEVAFVLKRDLEGAETVADVISAIDYVLPAIEIVGAVVEFDQISAFDLIADNAGGSFFVLGHTPRSLQDVDVVNCEMIMTVNGEERTRGFGRSNYGSALNTLTWLVRQRQAVGLKAGHVIMAGSLGAMIPAKAGDEVYVSISGLGDVCINFSV